MWKNFFKKNKKILAVDDEPLILELLEVQLKKAGYELITSTGGTEALSLVEKNRPDLIILDVMMPPPDGFHVCNTLKNNPDYRHIPIIMLTSEARAADKIWGMEAEADAYIIKPYQEQELLRTIKELLDK